MLLWLADSLSPARLAPPDGIAVRDGAQTCVADGGCGPVAQLELAVQAEGDRETLAPGERADVGPFVAVHAGRTVSLPGPALCDDSGGHRITVALVRGDVATLDARDRPACGAARCEAGEVCELPDAAACDRGHEDARCVSAPATCDPACPGVCGCDGRFHCSACWAARADVPVSGESLASCTPGVCESDVSAVGTDGCTHLWLCFGERYELRCARSGAGVQCTCARDGVTVHDFERAELPSCESEDAASACGFPWWRRGRG